MGKIEIASRERIQKEINRYLEYNHISAAKVLKHHKTIIFLSAYYYETQEKDRDGGIIMSANQSYRTYRLSGRRNDRSVCHIGLLHWIH